MEFGLREILFLVGIVVVAGILLDGYRRMRKQRLALRPFGKVGQESGEREAGDWDIYRAELPNGGARVVKMSGNAQAPRSRPGDEIEMGDLADNFGSAQGNDADGLLDLTDMESVGEARSPMSLAEEANQPADANPVVASKAAANKDNDLFADDELLMAARAEQQARLNKATRKDRERETHSQRQSRHPAQPQPQSQTQPQVQAQPQPQQPAPSRKKENKSDAEIALPTPDFAEVVVINVMARAGEFQGPDLQRVLTSCGCHYGDMKIFHRHEQHNGKGMQLFSIANVVEPGFFEAEQMDRFRTPGICMFMRLPGPKRPLQAYDTMMDCARKIATMLDGDIKDEHHNLMRQQTAEHYRQRVQDFERKLLAFQAGQRQH